VSENSENPHLARLDDAIDPTVSITRDHMQLQLQLQSLDLSPEQMIAANALVAERLAEFFRSYASRPAMGEAHDPERNFSRADLDLGYLPQASAPEEPSALTDSLSLIFDRLAPLSQLPGHPGYMAYVAGAGNHLSSLGQLIAMDLNPFSGHRMMAPGLVALEMEALDWFKTILGYPKEAAGFFTSGSSLATLSALVTARFALLGEEFANAAIYVSDQSHHCLRKAARLAGFPMANLRVIGTHTRTYRIDLTALERQIAFFIVGNAGTTNTGAIDDLRKLRAIATREKMWLHADGAYGALFRVTEEGKSRLAGLDSADSICFDPHKSFGLPYGTGALLVRDGHALKQAHSGSSEASSGASASYMPPEPEGDAASSDFADLSPELSRDFRGLRVWLPIKTLGLQPFRKNLDEKMTLARFVADGIRATEGLELLAEPQLSILAFTVSDDPAAQRPRTITANALTETLLKRINTRRQVFLSGCELKGRKAIRVCLLSFRAHEREAELVLREIRETWIELLNEIMSDTSSESERPRA
jgi:aromatic-L-amino-acid decarboxylase